MQVAPLFFCVEIIFSVLFLGYVAARKRTKKNGGLDVSLVATSDAGAARDPRPF